MRNISFALTTQQIRNQSKTVTRRIGWKFLTIGDLLQPIEKGQGIKKGEHVKKIGPPIRVTRVTRERLDRLISEPEYGRAEVAAEGFSTPRYEFPERHTPTGFVSFFCSSHGCQQWDEVTRVEFKYVEAPA